MRALLIPSLRVGAAACALCAAVALGVALAGQRDTARTELAFGFPTAPRELAHAAAIAAHNARYAAAVLIACLAVGWAPTLRVVLDAALAALLGFNATLIGVALGAYGLRLAQAIAVHGTLELAAFALVGGAYLRARSGELGWGELTLAAAGSLLLVAAAGLLEAWVAPGARP